jgi:ankyrin repeat protein
VQSPAARNSVASTVRFEPESTRPSLALESAVSDTNDFGAHHQPENLMRVGARNPAALLMNESHTKYHGKIRPLSSFLPFEPDGNGQISRLPTNTPYVEFLTGLYTLSNNIFTRDTQELVQKLLEICRSKDGLSFLRELLTSRNRTIMAAAEKLLVSAVYANDESLAKFLLNGGTSPDGMFPTQPGFEPQSSLKLAVKKGDKNLVSLLIGAGARFNSFTLLFVALGYNFDIEIVKLILQHPVPDGEILQWNRYFTEELLRLGSDIWSIELVDLLLVYISKTTGINYKKAVEGLLLIAVIDGKQEVVEHLLSVGARLNLNRKNMVEGIIPTAVTSGKQEVVACLLSLGVDVNIASPNEETLLESAVRMNDVSMVELLFSHGAVLNREQQGHIKLPTALQIAAQHGSRSLVCFLLNHGAHIDAEPFDFEVPDPSYGGTIIVKMTTLQSGVKGGNLAVVEMLLEAGASLEASSLGQMIQTALEIACDGGSDEIIYLLLSYGAKVNAETKSLWIWHTPLTRALSRRRKHIILLLLERGADVNIPSKNSRFPSPLQVCVAGGDIDMVKRLLDLGAHPYDSGALWAAAYTGSFEIILLLLQHNKKFINFHRDESQINWKDYGRAAISTAIEKRDFKSAHLLLEAGVNVARSPAIKLVGIFNGKDSVIHNTKRTALAAAISVMDIHWVRMLLDAGADVNACHSGNLSDADCVFDQLILTSPNIEEMVELLIASGACINRCKSTYPLLRRAVSQQLPAIVRLLLLKGADINLLPGECSVRTALQTAAARDLVDMVVILIGSGADTNVSPAAYEGATAIQFAAMNGNFEVLQLLLTANANLFAPRGIWRGRTALEGAAEHGRLDMVQFILKKSIQIEGLYFEHQLCRASKYARKSGHIVLAEMIQSYQVERYGSAECCGHESVFVLESRVTPGRWGERELLQAQTAFPGRCFDSVLYDQELGPAEFWSLFGDDSESADHSDSIASPSAPANDQESFIPDQDIMEVVSPAEMEGVDFRNDWHPEVPHSQQGYQHGYDEMLMIPPFDTDQIVPEATSPDFIIEELF